MADDARLQVVLEANIVKLREDLTKANSQIAKYALQANRDLNASNDNIRGSFAKTFGPDVQKSIDGVAGRLSGVTSKLSGVGPAGLLAAAGVGAIVVALNGAREAVLFADEIGDAANKIHVTTDEIQTFRAALQLAGGEAKDADGALESFSSNLGKAQVGLPKSVKAFKELGFSKEQIDSFATADQALRAVVDRIGKLGSNAQKDAVIDQLGLQKLKPLIMGGTDALNGFLSTVSGGGQIMDSSLIAKGGELNDQFEKLHRVIDVQLKEALIGLGPVLVGLLNWASKIATAFNDMVSAIRNSPKDAATDTLKRQRDTLSKQNANPNFVYYDPTGQMRKENDARIRQIDGILKQREAADKAAAEAGLKAAREGAKLVEQPGAGAGRAPKQTKLPVIVSGGNTGVDPASRIEEGVMSSVTAQVQADRQKYISDALAQSQKSVSGQIDAINKAVTGAWELNADQLGRMKEEFRYTFSDGIKAAIDGDLGNYFSNLADRFSTRLLDNLADSFFDSIFKGQSSGGGFLGSALSFLNPIQHFASGTNFAPGGLSLVGEQGAELVNLPRGSQVIPNHQLSALRGGGGSNVVAPVNISIDARGSTLDAARVLSARLDQMQRDLPLTIVRTVNDAQQRRRIG